MIVNVEIVSSFVGYSIKFKDKTYEKTGVWNYQNLQYWVVYNGELPDGTN